VTTTHEEARPGEEFRSVAGGLSVGELRALSRLDALRATFSVSGNVLVLVAAVAGAVRARHPALVALAMVVIAAGQHGLAVLMHEAAHHRLYRSRFCNDLIGRLCAWPMGLSMLTYRMVHRIHHNHLYEDIDPDLALVAGYPRGRTYLLRKLLKDFLGITTIKNFRYFMGGSLGRQGRDDTSTALRAAARRDRRWALGVYLGLLFASIAAGWGAWFLLLWVLPLLTLLPVVLRLRALCEHGAVTDRSSPLRAARTTLAPWWLRWLFFPHFVGYHVEHHLYPSVPHYRLPACHRALTQAGVLAAAEVTSLRGAFAKLFAEPVATSAPTVASS
jgi:fatty acid desaturase